MPNLFHFAKGLPIQSADLAYGVKTATKFCVTSSFLMTSDVKAYAMLSGTILLQQQTETPNKVNLILKPNNLSGIKMPVKYIVYRGLQTSSFLNGTNLNGDSLATIKTDESTELLKELASIQRERMNIQPMSPVTIPLQSLFGYNLAPTNTLDIDTFFYRQETTCSSQLFYVLGGMELGNFAVGVGGIEIILENSDLVFTIELAREKTYTIDISGVTNAVEKKWRREQIRYFVDPAAFYGLHSDIKGGIGYRDSDVEPTEGWPNAKSIQSVYENIIDKFKTKNAIYLDIRSENGYSYDYYDIYSNGSIKINDIQKSYTTNGWPLFDISQISDWHTSFGYFDLSLKIANSTDVAPLIIGRYAVNITNDQSDNVTKNKGLFLVDNLIENNNTYTKKIIVKIPIFMENDSNHNVATIVRFDYVKKPHVGNTASLLSQQSPTDFLFGPFDVKIPWQGNASVRWMNSYINRYFYSDEIIAVMQSGMAEESLNGGICFTYYTAPVVYFKNSKRIKDVYAFNFNGATIDSKNFITYFDLKSSAGIDKDYVTNTLFYKITSAVFEGGDTFLLGLTNIERNRLFPANIFSKYHYVFFKLLETSEQNKFELITVGVVVSNNDDMVREEYCNPNAPVYVYSRDNKIFTSVDYQTAIDFTPQPDITVHFRRTDDYVTNRFHFGFDWMREGNKRDNSKEETYVSADGLCEKANIDGTSYIGNVAKDYLKNEYTPEIINGQTYYVPWLCMYKNHSEIVTGNANNKDGKVILQLHIDYNGEQKNEIIRFIPSEGINIDLNLKEEQYFNNDRLKAKVAFLNNQQITIECTEYCDQDRNIEVFDSKGSLIGKLNIFRNSKKIDDLSIKFIKINFIGTLTPVNQTSPQIEFRQQENGVKYGIKVQKYFFENWIKNVINTEQNVSKKLLHQCLVEYPPSNRIVKTDNLTISLCSGEAQDKISINGGVFNEYILENVNVVTNFRNQVNFIDVPIGDTDSTPIAIGIDNTNGRQAMIDLVRATGLVNKNLHEISIFYFPLPVWVYNEGFAKETAWSVWGGNIIFLCGMPNNIPDETIAHEIAHCLNLDHSFLEINKDYDDNGNIYNDNKKFIFKRNKTENVMDYSNTNVTGNIPDKVSFWRWQWERILDNNE